MAWTPSFAVSPDETDSEPFCLRGPLLPLNFTTCVTVARALTQEILCSPTLPKELDGAVLR